MVYSLVRQRKDGVLTSASKKRFKTLKDAKKFKDELKNKKGVKVLHTYEIMT